MANRAAASIPTVGGSRRVVAAAGSDTVPKALGVAKEGLGPPHKEGVSLIGALVGEHLRETLSFTHPALKIAATLLGAAAKPLRARLRQAAIMPENDVMLALSEPASGHVSVFRLAGVTGEAPWTAIHSYPPARRGSRKISAFVGSSLDQVSR